MVVVNGFFPSLTIKSVLLKQFFEEAFEFIDRAKASSNGVLIHCQAGVSRSPTIAVAYLMKYYPMAMSDAYKFVKRHRSIISPNLNFMGQLYEFEQGLRHEAEARCNDTNELDMRNRVSMTPEGISKPSLDVRASSWPEA